MISTNRLQWRSFNCFSSAVGSLLSFYKYPFISSVLDSSWDFYYHATIPLGRSSAGVWPGPEHMMVMKKAKAVFDVDVHVANHDDWETIRPEVENSGKKLLIAVTVLNHVCDYIPAREIIGKAAHYLLVVDCDKNHVTYYDSFFDKSGTMALEELQEAMDFVASDGTIVKNRICTLRRNDTQSTESNSFAESQYRTHIRMFFLRPTLEELLRVRGRIFFGPEGIRELALDIDHLSEAKAEQVLAELSQGLKDVHYQRFFFVRCLKEMKTLYPWIQNNIETMVEKTNAVVSGWFRIKTLALYTARKKTKSSRRNLQQWLLKIADEEECLLADFVRIREALKRKETGP